MRSVLFILLLSFCSSISCEGYFTVIGSKLIRQRTKYHVSVTSQGYDEPQILEIAIRNTKKSDNKYEVVQNVTLVNGEAQKVEFDLKGQPMVDYSLEVESLSGNDFSKTVKLNMNTKKNSVLVQTDKSMYKPSDKIQFRVLALNADMKPLIIRKVQVFITDGAQNRVKQFNDVKMTKGVYQNELQLSDSPVMGMWKINVKINNDKEVSKEFEVAEYTLPKFEVTIDANPDANFKDGKIRATVRATYTFGKIAKGNATVTAEVPNPDRWNRHRGRKVSRAIEINGKKSIEFDIKNDLDIRDTGKEVTVKLRATFTEELTGRDQNATAEVTIHITPHKIEMRKSSERIKPGLPFSATAIVKHHDKGAPVSDPYNSVKFTIKYHYDTVKTCERRNYYNGFGPQFGSRPFERSPIGYPQFGYPQFGSSQIGTESYSCRQEHSYEKIKEGFLTDGMSEIDIDIPSNTTKIDVTAKYLETKETVENIKRQESESKEYIQVKAATKNSKISENVKIDVLATTNIVQLTYQVIGKGDVIVSQNVPVPNAKSFSFEFMPTLAMIPKASVIVFYITSSGEIISDSLKIEFATELKNFVNIELSKDQVKPGDSLEISVSSKANSYVGLLGVDQSVLLLKKGNDIEKSTVFEEIKKYNEVNRENQIYDYSYDYKTHKDFEISDAVIITNAKKEYERPYVPMESPYGYRDFPMYSMRPQPYYPMRFGGFGGSATSASASSQSFGLSVPMPNSVSYQSMDRRYEDKIAEMKPMVSVPVKPKVIEIRKTFPETWIFDSFDFNSTTTNVKLSKKVPDTITSWIITAFSIDPNTGLGLARQPSKFNVFQPFFVSTNLPYSIKRGEVVSIPILVFNYLEGDQEAEVTLFNSEGEFEFVEKKENVNQVNKRKRAIETQRKKTVLVKSQSGLTVPFMIRPLKVGHITIKVTASSAVAGDGVERQLIVEPEGVTQYMNKAVFIDLRNNPEFKMNFNIEIPSNAVPDSTKIEASAIGDILGPSLDNLDALIKLPYGCGEQNMLNFVPNIVVLDYLTTLNLLSPEIESKAKTYLESGYQRELTYKHDDGSYSVFGKSDKSGSTWLSAFVAKSFNQALKYIAIDEEIIKKALSFLSKVQKSDGSFPEVGYVFDKAMQGGSSKGIGLTAYTLITFLENEKLGKIYQTTIDRAINFIKQNLDSLDDNYSLAIASYAMQLAKHGSKDSLLAKLDAKSVNKNGMKHWEKAVPKSDENSPWSYRPNSVNVEMSAYGLQALVEANRESDAVQVMKWLVTQRNENGGFQSTQDTVVGLQALAKLAMKIYVADSNIDIELKPSSNNNILFNVNAENALVLQKHDVQSEARTFEVSAKGNGFGVLQLSYKYNLNINGEWPRFIVMPEVHQNSNKDFLHLVVCTNFVTDDSDVKSNMAVMEVSFPSGFTFDSDSRSDLLLTEKVKKVETKDGDTIVVVYFESLSAKKICPELKAYRTHSVSKQKPVPVKVYDYYDNSRQATNFYNPPEVSLCDICDGDEECIEDCEEMEINVD